ECRLDPIGLDYSLKCTGAVLRPVRRTSDMDVETGRGAKQEADVERQHAAAEMAGCRVGYLVAVRCDHEARGRLRPIPDRFDAIPCFNHPSPLIGDDHRQATIGKT